MPCAAVILQPCGALNVSTRSAPFPRQPYVTMPPSTGNAASQNSRGTSVFRTVTVFAEGSIFTIQATFRA